MADDWESLKREVAEEQRLQDQEQGSYNQLRKLLRKKFGVKTLKEAQALADKTLEEVHNHADTYLKKKRVYERLLKRAKKARKQ